jgi:hypothetical protein
MPVNYPVWKSGVTPHTDPNARASRTRLVNRVRAIWVRGATYRGCQPIDGVFELVDSRVQRVKGEDRYEVYCAWFGVKPPTVYPRLLVRPDACRVIPDYTGEVVDNISA